MKRITGVLKGIAPALLVFATLGALASCGGKSGSDTSFTMWIYSGVDSTYYTEYKDNPALQYAMSKTWGDGQKKVDIEFWVPPAGTAQDNYSTMMNSGNYPDVLDASVDPSPISLYEDGIVLDLTDLIPANMPNYMKFIEKYPSVKPYVYSEVDGQQKMLSIVGFNEGYGDNWCGNMYRRDWIVKYGRNPFTGVAFTGGYTDKSDVDSWVDDVVFPSGGSDPVYISDWEWMFEIFTRAQKDLGIANSYSYSMYYPGYTWSGGLVSCFGAACNLWYAPEDTNKVTFGGDTDSFRAYMECLNSWYKKGWLDKSFNERTSDAHYAIDDTNVRQGKVGLWLGIMSGLGGRLDMHDGGYTEGICVYGCAWPINDLYGTEATKNIAPYAITVPGIRGTSYYITSAAKDKDVATLLRFFDYFYSDEGALLHSIGLNAEQVKEIDNKFYKNIGMEAGAYTVAADGRYKKCDLLQNDNAGLAQAAAALRLPGITLIDSIDLGYAPTLRHSLDTWIQYRNYAFFQGSTVTNAMNTSETNEASNIQTKILEYMATNVPAFIKGTKDIKNDKQWSEWCTIMKKYNYERVNAIFQPYVDKYEFRDDHN